MATMKDTVKETLVGFKADVPVTSETRSAFLRHALKDEEGEFFLDREKFVDVIAPATEDYVSSLPLYSCTLKANDKCGSIAENQA
jgi:solute carrier family 25 aspartate/glutamate transporter 12/13